MNREHQEELVELGVVSTDTRGEGNVLSDQEGGKIRQGGLSDD
jgi:hypothetical protein